MRTVAANELVAAVLVIRLSGHISSDVLDTCDIHVYVFYALKYLYVYKKVIAKG